MNDSKKCQKVFELLSENGFNICQDQITCFFTGTKSKIAIKLSKKEVAEHDIEKIENLLTSNFKNSFLKINLH